MDHSNGDAVARPSGAVRQVVDGLPAISAVGRRGPLAGAETRARRSRRWRSAAPDRQHDRESTSACSRRGDKSDEALGRSRGGFTTKIHAVVESSGTLVRFALTGGQVNDITRAAELVCRPREADAVVGDRAYDSDAFVAHVEAFGMKVVIPSRARRRVVRPHDKDAYRSRNVIERYFGRLKQLRRVATRYDKTAVSYASIVAVAATLVSLTGWRA